LDHPKPPPEKTLYPECDKEATFAKRNACVAFYTRKAKAAAHDKEKKKLTEPKPE